MEYVITDKDGETLAIYEGDYCGALDYAAQLLKLPEGAYVSDYADIIDADADTEE